MKKIHFNIDDYPDDYPYLIEKNGGGATDNLKIFRKFKSFFTPELKIETITYTFYSLV